MCLKYKQSRPCLLSGSLFDGLIVYLFEEVFLVVIALGHGLGGHFSNVLESLLGVLGGNSRVVVELVSRKAHLLEVHHLQVEVLGLSVQLLLALLVAFPLGLNLLLKV